MDEGRGGGLPAQPKSTDRTTQQELALPELGFGSRHLQDRPASEPGLISFLSYIEPTADHRQ
jgi:hypothetical protein